MTIDIPEFDPGLSGHTAVVLEDDSEELCYATVTEHMEDGRRFLTEYGRQIHSRETELREVFSDAGVRMCGECWPLEELEDSE